MITNHGPSDLIRELKGMGIGIILALIGIAAFATVIWIVRQIFLG
jgi:hypothetical protein